MERLDTLGMWDATMAFPEQVEQAAAQDLDFSRLPSHDEIENVVVLGVGGSGIVGDVLLSVAGPFMATPVVVCKSYEPPSFAGPTTLCVAVSYSGDTEETIEAAQTAALAGAQMVVVAGGGELLQLGQAWDATVIGVPGGIPMPRAALGAMAIPTLLMLEHVGLFPGGRGWVDLAVEQLRRRRDELSAGESAAAFRGAPHRTHDPDRLWRRRPRSDRGAALEERGQREREVTSVHRDRARVDAQRDLRLGPARRRDEAGVHARAVAPRPGASTGHAPLRPRPQVDRRGRLGVEEVHAEGDGPLAQLLDLMFFGTVTSLELAAQEGVDPGPIPVLDEIKAAMSR